MHRIDRLEKLERALRGSDWPALLVITAELPAPWNDHKGDIPRAVQEQWVADGLADVSPNRKCVTYHGGRNPLCHYQTGTQYPSQWPIRATHAS